MTKVVNRTETAEIKAIVGVKKTEVHHTENHTHISGVDSIRITDGTAHVHTVIEEVNWKDVYAAASHGMGALVVVSPWILAVVGVGFCLKLVYVFRIEIAIGAGILAAAGIIGYTAYKIIQKILSKRIEAKNEPEKIELAHEVVVSPKIVGEIIAVNQLYGLNLKEPPMHLLLARMSVLSKQQPGAHPEYLYRCAVLEYNQQQHQIEQ